MTSQTFSVTLEEGPGGGPAIRVPFDPKATFGKARAPVRVTIDKHPEFRTTIMVYSGIAWIGLRKGQVTDMRLASGDRVDVSVDLDDLPRTVDVPAELVTALEQDPQALAAYQKLSFTHRKEYARWVAEAKREATRQARVAKTLERLKAGINPSF
ncbi:MAG TPA: YdeI/OmpD-associated family protein [Trebonia sp.]|nr:YdeI/OmpD-associated family protein [Trebonia sp.]